MDRLSKLLLIPTSIATLAGFGLSQMTNVLQPYWPDAPHWVFAGIFLSGAALVFVPFPAWLIWLGWKNGKNFGRRARMIAGFAILICGCALGVLGLSIIAAGEKHQVGNLTPGSADELVARARLLYSKRSDTMSVLSTDGDVRIASLDKDNSIFSKEPLNATRILSLSGSEFLARFSFQSNAGPFSVSVDSETFGPISTEYDASIKENERNYVKLRLYPRISARSSASMLVTGTSRDTVEILINFRSPRRRVS